MLTATYTCRGLHVHVHVDPYKSITVIHNVYMYMYVHVDIHVDSYKCSDMVDMGFFYLYLPKLCPEWVVWMRFSKNTQLHKREEREKERRREREREILM